MTEARTLRLGYLGWSGFHLFVPGGIDLYIDPPAGTPLPRDRITHVLITHGHPEHVAGTVAHLRDPARTASMQIAAAAPICRHLHRYALHVADRFHVCLPQQHFEFAGFSIDVFKWTHMPVLPPGLGATLRHLRRLASHPGLAARIVIAGLRGPRPRPMLGFRVTQPGHTRILAYGEGLHRRTTMDQIDRVASELPADILLAAIEPEDLKELPELVRRIGSPIIALYQAHQGWREEFGMALADLDAFAGQLAQQGQRALTFRSAGTVVVQNLSPAGSR